MWHPGLQIVQENLKISQMRQKSYATVPFFSDLCNTYLELATVMPGQCCLNKIEPYIVGFFLFLDLTNLCFLFNQLRCQQNKKTLETVQWVMVFMQQFPWSSRRWYKISLRKQHTTRRMVRRLASVANSTASLVVKFVQLKMKLQLGGTRGCSPVQRERGLIKSN